MGSGSVSHYGCTRAERQKKKKIKKQKKKRPTKKEEAAHPGTVAFNRTRLRQQKTETRTHSIPPITTEENESRVTC